MNARVIFKGLALILSLALLGYLFESSDLADSINESWIDTHVRSHGAQGALLFLLMGAVFTGIGLPRQIIGFLGGYAFNTVAGALLGTLAALLGCMLTFAYARLFGRGLLRARLGARAQRFDAFIHAHPFSMTLLIRLLPVGSNALTNLAAGMSSIPARIFFAATFIGYLPQSLVFALVGSGVHIAPGLKLGGAVALFLLSGALGAYLYRRNRHGLSLDDRIDAALRETESR
jgi:uncharacterized membrane protein YdjX (TVP38/TMEM64 family)